jgi:iron complex transport system substrate-binding protein
MAALVAAGAMLLTGCSSASSTGSGAASPSAATSAHVTTVKSCDHELTFAKPPQRVIMMGDTDASILVPLGVMDKVIGRAGEVKSDGYDAATLARIKAVPTIASTPLDTGGAKLATETVLQERADLVIGYDEGVDRAALAKSGVQVYSPSALCNTKVAVKHASFDLVNQEVTKIGEIFGVQDKAKALNVQLTKQADDLKKAAGTKTRSAAAFWVAPGSTEFYTYGTSSMVQPIFEVNGLRNVYDDQQKRVFDATMEDVLKRNPEWIVLLAQDGALDQTKSTFLKFKGASQLQAVKKNQVVVMPFSLTDPPTPQSLKGAEVLSKLLTK